MNKVLNLDQIVDSIVDVNEVVEKVLKEGDFKPTRELGSVLPYTKRVGINDIVPEEYQQKLMEIDMTMSQCFWIIGDITTDIIDNVNRERARELGKVVSKTDVFEAVGVFCHRSARSVRHYYECAHYFPVEVRQKYDVPFSIYSLARWVKDWELMLQIAEENPIWPAERVRAEYYKQIGETPPVRERDENEPGVGGVEVTDEPSVSYKEMILNKLEHTVDDLRTLLDRIPLPTDVRVRIGDLILEIQNISLDVRREV